MVKEKDRMISLNPRHKKGQMEFSLQTANGKDSHFHACLKVEFEPEMIIFEEGL